VIADKGIAGIIPKAPPGSRNGFGKRSPDSKACKSGEISDHGQHEKPWRFWRATANHEVGKRKIQIERGGFRFLLL